MRKIDQEIRTSSALIQHGQISCQTPPTNNVEKMQQQEGRLSCSCKITKVRRCPSYPRKCCVLHAELSCPSPKSGGPLSFFRHAISCTLKVSGSCVSLCTAMPAPLCSSGSAAASFCASSVAKYCVQLLFRPSLIRFTVLSLAMVLRPLKARSCCLWCHAYSRYRIERTHSVQNTP